MAFTQDDIDTLDRDIATDCVNEVLRFSDGREVRKRTVSEMIKLRDYIRSTVVGGTRRIRQVRLYSEKGF